MNLAQESIASYVENLTLLFVLDLLGLPHDAFQGRTLTTGATCVVATPTSDARRASNVLGLAVGREHAIKRAKGQDWSVADDGFGGVEVDVFAAGAHACSLKAAALVGIGRKRVREMRSAKEDGTGCSFDFDALEVALAEGKRAGRSAIILPSFGEVNTGGFTADIPRVRKLADQYGAWIHIDAAFGGFAGAHSDFSFVRQGLMLADSITLDGHKWLNTAYDCGIFLTRRASDLTNVLGGTGALPAYLAVTQSNGLDSSVAPQLASARQFSASQASPLHLRIENSCRFRALPLYAAFLSIGKRGYEELIVRNIDFARHVAEWIRSSPYWELLTPPELPILNIVLFAPRTGDASEAVKLIKATGRIYVGPTAFNGRPALRLAVSNYATTIEDDWPTTQAVLEEIGARLSS